MDRRYLRPGGPDICAQRPPVLTAYIPAKGIMSFDTADLAKMEQTAR